ncbi:MAG: DUF6458 family protein [Gaiellaceae bacterium]
MYSPAGLTIGLILIAVGAILVWAVTGDAEGVNIDAVGWILMIVGAAAALISLMFWSSAWGPMARRREYVEGRPRRRTVIEEEDDLGPPPAL